MTTTSSIHNMKTKLTTSNSVNNISTNGNNNNNTKSSRIYFKRPLSTTGFLSNNSSTNGSSNQVKKRTLLQFNNFFHSKIKPIRSNEQTNGHQTDECPSPLIFHAIAPASSNTLNNLSKQTDTEQKSNNELQSPASRRIANIFAHTKIKAMSTDCNSLHSQSSCSDEDDDDDNEHSLKFYPILSSIDADADESDNGNNHELLKFRRFQKTRKSSCTSLTQKFENNIERQHSSSNDDENKETKLILNGNNERRLKPLTKKFDHKLMPTTTTTDDDVIKHIHHYHPLDDLQTKESSLNSTLTTTNNQSSIKKINRFQIKSIRKSQQQHILLANIAAAKSSNEDDCSVPNDKSNLQLKPSIIQRKSTNTPTTDGEHSTTITDSNISTLNSIENGHSRVRFHVTPYEKKESTVHEEEKLSVQATTITLPTPAPPSSSISVKEHDDDDDEEEEAIAKSPDGRFIKYAKEIGRGAFKTVYRGLDTETSVAVAWCELQDFAQFDKHERLRFKEEAEMLKKLQHPNIVRFYDFWEETNPRTNKKVIILVTELMTSGSLKSYIRKFKGQKEDKRINVMKKWCRQILKGLAYLHSRNPPVIHRDLKCDNVFISSTTGCVKIGDLGLATFKTQTFAKSMRGTMEFMAPEMFDEQYDELVDIYSFGLCMLEMITGEYPYIECKGPTAVIKRVTAGLKPDCYYKVENEDVREVINCCIRTHKEERLPVNELLQHSFFLDDNGLRIDYVHDTSNDLQTMITNNSIDLKLKIIDKTKRKSLWTEHEAIRFRYNFITDTPEQIVDELIQKKYIFDDDKKFIIQSIKDRVRAYNYEQIDRKAGVFYRYEKPLINQSALVTQHQQQVASVQSLQPPTAPLVVQSQIAASVPTPTIVQQISVEIPQQQQQVVKPSSEIPPSVKPVISTEPISITQLSDISSSVSGSAGSLEILDAALKKTFNKNNAPQSTSTIVTLSNENIESSSTIINQDETLPSISKLGIETSIIDHQQKEESTTNTIIDEDLLSSSTPSTLQTQLTIPQNPILLTQTSQSFSCSTVTPSHTVNNTLSTDSIKQAIPSSSSVIIIPETIDNNHTPISPLQTNESLIPSDTTTTTPQPILGSLKQLDALLKNTFKNSTKSTGTAHNSDTETTNPIISLTINDENSHKLNDIESDETKRKLIDLFNDSNPNISSIVQSQPNTSSIILPKTISQIKSQPTIHFDPLISPQRSLEEFDDTSTKILHDKSLSNDDTIIATSSSSSNDLSEIKSMIMDLNKLLINRMNTIENKIDEHQNQTIQINNLLTKTILPSLCDLVNIISQTSNIDPRIRTKLENIQKNIQISQQQTEMKDLMEI